MRVVAHAAIVWVGWYFMPWPELGLVSVPIIGAGTWKIWKFWEGLGRRLGKFLLPLVVCIDRLDVVTCRVTRWHGRGCRATWLGVGCSGQPVGQGAHVDVVAVWGLCGRLAAVTCFGDSEDLGACVMVSTGRSLGATARSYPRQDGADAAARFEKFLPARAFLRPPISLKFATE